MKKEDFKVGVSFRVEPFPEIYKVEPTITGSENLCICDAKSNTLGFVGKINDAGVVVEKIIMNQLATFTLPFAELELLKTNP